ncbi:TetR/AcrR family transcriptional regulator [Bacillus sp. FSL K6-1145]|uniref:TetR/AcrR family transcriptional regulator n=1 Tax=Bacillus sp. FSL K6-1145 TaxID=2921464 RepID=UPI0030F7812C
MNRIVKKPEERRSEIISVAKDLFSSNGYENTTISDIIKKIGVAKGTFYHYFKSKDEIADAVIQDSIDSSVQVFKQINNNSDLKAIEKFINIIQFFSQETSNHFSDGLMTHLHHKDNVLLHQKMKVCMIKEYVPIISSVLKQGVEEGVFHTDFPDEITEFLLVGLHFMLDPSLFSLTHEQLIAKLDAIDEIYEKLLGAPKGSFPSIKQYFEKLY